VRLTAAGKIFFGEARDILVHVVAAMEKVRTSIASQAEINVGYLPSGTVGMLSRPAQLQSALS
jgi:DNA-binding transcriptional LysR family regulator